MTQRSASWWNFSSVELATLVDSSLSICRVRIRSTRLKSRTARPLSAIRKSESTSRGHCERRSYGHGAAPQGWLAVGMLTPSRPPSHASMSPLPPDLRWSFLLTPNASWFESFAMQLSGPDISILMDHEDDKPTAFAWSSRHLSDLATPEEVKDRATALKALFDGAMYVYMPGKYRPLQLGELYDLDEDRRLGYLGEGDPLVAPFSPTSIAWRYRPSVSPMEHPVSRWIFLARHIDVAKHLLQFLGVNGITWISLYAALDFLKSNKADAAALAKASQAQMKRFTHTANNFSAIGPFARHGDLGQEPPQNPMSLDEASKLVLAAVRGYLEQLVIEAMLSSQWEAKLLYQGW